LVKERAQHSNRIKALLSTQGVPLKNVNRWLPKTLETLTIWDGSPLPQSLKSEVLREHERWLLTHEQVRKLDTEREAALQARRQEVGHHSSKLEQVEHLIALRGVGMVSAWTLTHEFFWRDFNNRREVGAAAGLTGTPFDSGDSAREQGISKSGNASIRALMVELAWSWLRFQPESELSRWYQARFAQGKRFRKVGIVALARKLLIALWRYNRDGIVPAGATLKELPLVAA
jgi:transposase